MRLCILANEALKNEFLQKNIPAGIDLRWETGLEGLVNADADAYFDLLFKNEPSRIDALKKLLPKPVYINAVTDTLAEIGQPFIRINAWPGFLNRSIIEVVGNAVQMTALDALGWKYKAVPDQPGMIAPRVIAMIINEAYFALGEEVSTKEEIDTAMKLGTNYPFGPFEWAEKIGLEKIAELLGKLSNPQSPLRETSAETERYIIAKALASDVAIEKIPS